MTDTPLSQITLDQLRAEIKSREAVDDITGRLCEQFFQETRQIPPPMFSLAAHIPQEARRHISLAWQRFHQAAFERAWELYFKEQDNG